MALPRCPYCKTPFKKGWPAQRYCSVECAAWFRVDMRRPDECWPWTGSRKKGAYGGLTFHGKRYDAHRVIYHYAKGRFAKGRMDGALVMHSCDNPICCNPYHLSVGTHADNAHDMWERGRGVSGYGALKQQGSAHGAAKLTEAEVLQIRAEYRPRGNGPELAARFGVSNSLIHNIIRRKAWKHI